MSQQTELSRPAQFRDRWAVTVLWFRPNADEACQVNGATRQLRELSRTERNFTRQVGVDCIMD